MTTEPLDLATFKRNSDFTIDATINALDGTPADITALSGDDIRWAISASRRGPRLATVDLSGADTGTGEITKTDAANGRIRIQFRPPLPPADPDPFKARNKPYWQECEVTLSEVLSTQFYGPVRIEASMFSEEE